MIVRVAGRLRRVRKGVRVRYRTRAALNARAVRKVERAAIRFKKGVITVAELSRAATEAIHEFKAAARGTYLALVERPAPRLLAVEVRP